MPERYEHKLCPRCGSTFAYWIEDEDKQCRCGVARQRGRQILEEVDPNRSFTLRSLQPEPTLDKTKEHGLRMLQQKADKGLFLIGEPGIGKTHLMIALFRKCFNLDFVPRYHNYPRMIAEIQSSYRDPDKPTPQVYIDHLAKSDPVFLDDIGKERRSEDVSVLTYQVIDALYTARRFVVASTNLDAEEFFSRYDNAVTSRLRGMCEFYKIEGVDRRANVAFR